jgi:Ca2+/Na+ antiporter
MNMNQDTLVFIGAFGGAAVGVLGGVIGTWFSIKNTGGPRERAFAIRASVMFWLGITAFLAALWFVPSPYHVLLWLAYLAALLLTLRAWNRRQQQIRHEESGGAGEGFTSKGRE